MILKINYVLKCVEMIYFNELYLFYKFILKVIFNIKNS